MNRDGSEVLPSRVLTSARELDLLEVCDATLGIGFHGCYFIGDVRHDA